MLPFDQGKKVINKNYCRAKASLAKCVVLSLILFEKRFSGCKIDSERNWVPVSLVI